MPIHVYRCKKCNKKFEAVVLDRNEKIHCPSCKSCELEKQLTSFNASTKTVEHNPPVTSCTGCPSGGMCGI